MSKTTYYKTCSECGSNLDPGERCVCRKERVAIVARDCIKDKRKRPLRTA